MQAELIRWNTVGWVEVGWPTSFTPRIPEHQGRRLQPARRGAFCVRRLGGMQNARLRKRVFRTRVESFVLPASAQATRASVQLGLKNQV